jgi:5-methylcytosine-specific restriction endonuclease McrA
MARHKFYCTREWKKVARLQALHDADYKCSKCGRSMVGLGKLAIVHHRKPLKLAPALRSEPLNLAPTCTPCHNRIHAEMRSGKPRGACDEAGYPLDVNHPWVKAKLEKE